MSEFKLKHLTKSNKDKYSISPELQQNETARKHYYSCLERGEFGVIKCWGLVNNNSIVGFIGFSIDREKLNPIINLYVSIDYVFIQPSLRRRKLSCMFLELIENKTTSQIKLITRKFNSDSIYLIGASLVGSYEGEILIHKLNNKLENIANITNVKFT